jgi:hypothetical protein
MSVSDPPSREFEELVHELLTAVGYRVAKDATGASDRGYDLLANFGSELWAIEIKYYRTERAQLDLLDATASRLLRAVADANARKGMIVISAYLPDELRLALEARYGLVFVDRSDILIWASNKQPPLSERFSALFETNRAPITTEGRSPESIAERDIRPASPATSPDTLGTDLCAELRGLASGKLTWRKYEGLCDRILRYLFPNDLTGWRQQASTDDELNRFDYVCRVRPTTDFWQFVTSHLNSRYILFEFKNYTEPIEQGQVLTTEKYLLERALRRVGIIFTRCGAEPNALKMAQGAMREHGKLIIVLSDDDVCALLQARERGDDPSDLLFALVDDFLISLPR